MHDMKHLKTRLGTFWVAESGSNISADHKVYLGVDDDELAEFDTLEDAIKAVSDQATGYFKWDCQSKITTPNTATEWVDGQPAHWNKD
jgi:hypothetical protein